MREGRGEERGGEKGERRERDRWREGEGGKGEGRRG